MNAIYEVILMGLKRYGAEIVCSALIFISICFFPRLRSFLKRSLRDTVNTPASSNNPEAEVMQDIPDEDYPETEEPDDEVEEIILPEWVDERRKEFVNPANKYFILFGIVLPLITTFCIAVFFHIFNEGLIFILYGLVICGVIIGALILNSSIQLLIPEAERGNPHAQLLIGGIYRNKKAYQLSYVWLYLAGLCEHPRGYSQAAKLEKAGVFSGAKLSQLEAGSAKAEALRMFNEIKANRVTAFKYYLSKAWNGDSIAQYNLGYSYQHGEGTEQDIYSAYVWYSVASRSGDGKAQSRLEQLNGKLFPSQTAQADEEALRKFNAIRHRNTKGG